MVRQIIDLTIPLTTGMRGVSIEQTMSREVDGWNASTLSLYSHCGTHIDAPCHFINGEVGIDEVPLDVCIGPAKIVDLTPVLPGEIITVERFLERCPKLAGHQRVLLRTDWSQYLDTPVWREQLPRISRELAEYLVEQGVVLIGVEPPSITDVSDLDELADVHAVFMEADVVIIEGLVNLDKPQNDEVQLIALPLNLPGIDGSPARVVVMPNEPS